MNPREEDLGRRTVSDGGGMSGDRAALPGGCQPRSGEQSPINLAEQMFPARMESSTDMEIVSYPLPRRGYKPEAPHRYPWYRDNLLSHLRAKLSLSDLASVTLEQVRFSPGSLEILGKTITKRSVIEALESFLEMRRGLGKAHPYLLRDPNAPFFAARDGGPLLVSHRPFGMRERGRERFVELRDKLAGFLFRYRDEWTVEQVCSMNLKDLDSYVKSKGKISVQGTTLEALSGEYKTARSAWLAEVNDLVRVLRGHSLKNKSSALICEIARLEELRSAGLLLPEEERRLHELSVIRCGLEAEEREWRRRDLLMRKQRAVRRHLELNESASERLIEYLEEEPPKLSIMPVCVPNPRILFAGTDGGALIGDI
jgi:hypothetical protein